MYPKFNKNNLGEKFVYKGEGKVERILNEKSSIALRFYDDRRPNRDEIGITKLKDNKHIIFFAQSNIFAFHPDYTEFLYVDNKDFIHIELM